MRLQEIKHVLQQNIGYLNELSANRSGDNYYLENVLEFQTAIQELEKLNLFPNQISIIKNSAIFRRFEDSFAVHHSAWSEIASQIVNLKNTVASLLHALDNTSELDNENVISIKLPHIHNFNDLEKIANDLNKAISIPIAEEEIGGSVKIQGVDSGSIWFYIILGTPAAVSLIAGLAWAATVVFKKWQEGLAFREYVKNLKLQNEHSQALVAAQREQVNLLVTEQAKIVQEKNFKKKDSEQLERIKLSINTMSELIGKGFEIHPSLVAPENVSNLFPDFKSVHLPSFETKQISSGDNQENKS